MLQYLEVSGCKMVQDEQACTQGTRALDSWQSGCWHMIMNIHTCMTAGQVGQEAVVHEKQACSIYASVVGGREQQMFVAITAGASN